MAARRLSGLADAALIVLAACIAYIPSLSNGWIWDDDQYVTENPVLTSADGIADIWLDPQATPQYYPLVHTGYWLEWRAWGEVAGADGQPGPNPFGYHLDNLLLHALAAVLLWRVLRRLACPGGWIAALLFAVHPVMVESVAWVTERKNVLSGVFYLGAALAWLRFAGIGAASARTAAAEDERAEPLRWGSYALASGLFVAALLSKSVTASLPAALLLVLWWRKGGFPRRELVSLLALFPLAIASGLYTAALERDHVRAQGPYWDQSFVENLLIAGRACWFYLSKLAWPADLAFFYERWKPDAGALIQWIFPASAALLVGVAAAAVRWLGRGPLVAVLFFGGTLFPALSFLNVYPHRYSWVADHFQYHASIGMLALAAAGLASTPLFRGVASAREGPVGGRWPWPAWAPAAGLALVLGLLTWRQCAIYADEESLWRDTIEKTPTAYAAHKNLGVIHFARGEMYEGTEHYRKGLELDPHDPAGLYGPRTWEGKFGMSMMHLHMGNAAEAERFAAEALEVEPLDDWPEKEALARLNIGVARVLQDLHSEAVPDLRRAVAIQPALAPAWSYLGVALVRTGRTGEAIASLRQALKIDPFDLDALIALSWINSSHANEQRRNPAEAVRLATAACERSSYQYPLALDALAAAQAAAGEFGKAVSTVQRALRVAGTARGGALRGIEERLEAYRAGKPFRSPVGLP